MMRDKMRTKNVERRVIKCERVENDYKCKREREREQQMIPITTTR